ncbi:hypothetical protein CRUP_022331, partial [Coryphaenoides rupestris]
SGKKGSRKDSSQRRKQPGPGEEGAGHRLDGEESVMAAPDLLDPKSATHNSKPRLSFSTKSITMSPREESEMVATVMKWKTVSAIFFLVVLYLVMGALVFRALEQPHESAQRLAILSQKLEFLSRYPCVNHSQLEELVKQVVTAIRSGVNPAGTLTNHGTLWDLSSAFFFAGTVITTIGFGNTSPHTEGGRIFCIVYALLGIPLFGFLLAGVGDQLGTIFGKGIAKVEKTIVQWEISQTKIRVISTLLFVLFGCLLFVALPTTVFQHIEGWSALESLYFVVVTLTTIGFGDFVAGGSEIEYQDYYKPVVWFWILVGEIRAHAAEWTANVSAEFKETRRRPVHSGPVAEFGVTPPNSASRRESLCSGVLRKLSDRRSGRLEGLVSQPPVTAATTAGTGCLLPDDLAQHGADLLSPPHSANVRRGGCSISQT